ESAFDRVLLADNFDMVRLRLHQVSVVAFHEAVELLADKGRRVAVNVPRDNRPGRIVNGDEGDLASYPGAGQQLIEGFVAIAVVAVFRARLASVNERRDVE